MKSLILFFCIVSFHATAFQTDSLKNFSYSIDVPENWTVKDGCTEADCSFLAPQDNNQDTFLENINITVVDAPAKNYSAEKYTDFSIGYLPTVVENFELLERVKLPENASRITYKGLKSGYHQTWKQYYFIKSSKMYIVTFTAETPKVEEYILKIQSTLDSFKVK
jgi:hypothetical protein